jgi:hypothetical protein
MDVCGAGRCRPGPRLKRMTLCVRNWLSFNGRSLSELLVKSNSASASDEQSALWVCPKCGARLVSRNLWHSCGRFTLEALFAKAPPDVLELARGYVDMLYSLGDVQVIPQKTRLVCVARVRFAGLSPRKNGFRAGFALRRWLKSPRIAKRADYGPRWRGHFVDIRSATDLDDDLRAWLREAHDTVGIQSDIGSARPHARERRKPSSATSTQNKRLQLATPRRDALKRGSH